VKVSVYVPFVVLPTVAVVVAVVDPDGVTEAGDRLQVTPAAELHESATVPVKLFFGATVMVIVACAPALTVFVAGAEIVKSVTGCVTAADLLEVKLVSPA
jgi:hypothetical protein